WTVTLYVTEPPRVTERAVGETLIEKSAPACTVNVIAVLRVTPPLRPSTVIGSAPSRDTPSVTIVSVDVAVPLPGDTVCGLNPVPGNTWLFGRLIAKRPTLPVKPPVPCTVTL